MSPYRSAELLEVTSQWLPAILDGRRQGRGFLIGPSVANVGAGVLARTGLRNAHAGPDAPSGWPSEVRQDSCQSTSPALSEAKGADQAKKAGFP